MLIQILLTLQVTEVTVITKMIEKIYQINALAFYCIDNRRKNKPKRKKMWFEWGGVFFIY